MKSFKKQIEQKVFYCQQITMLQLKRHSRVNLKYEKSNKLVLTLDITTIVKSKTNLNCTKNGTMFKMICFIF